MSEPKITINIGADFAPTKFNEKYFCDGDIVRLLGKELCQILNDADLNIFNLETPLTDKLSPIPKCGLNLIASAKSVAAYAKIPKLLLGLANNHIMDQDVQGLGSTTSTLKQNGIDYCGAGKNLKEASRSKILEIKNKKIGVYACAEHEFSIADENVPGANPFDPLECYDQVQQLKMNCDYLIVLYHGGKEYYRYPSPNLQKYCRKFVEKGADLVVCQHTHCIGCRENYRSGVIVYGQGNFLLDFNTDDEYSHNSLLLKVILDTTNHVIEIPLSKNGPFVALASDEEALDVMKAYNDRSTAILDKQFIKKNYAAFANSMINGYLNGLLGNNILIRILNRLLGRQLGALLHDQKSCIDNYNCILCEAHRELLLEGLKNKYQKH